MTKAQKAKLLEKNWDLVTALEIIAEDELDISERLSKELDKLPDSGDLKDLDAYTFDKLSLDSQAELWDLLGDPGDDEDI